MNFSAIVTSKSVTVVRDGVVRKCSYGSAGYRRLRALVDEWSAAETDAERERLQGEMFESTSERHVVARVTDGRVVVAEADGKLSVRFMDREVHGVVADRILDAVAAGDDAGAMCKFLDKLMDNPNADVREDLLLWLERGKMPIVEDGDFIAFKKVRADMRDIYTGKILHTIGKEIVEEGADTDRDRTCSRGLHFCSKEYLPVYGGSEGNVVITVKINPKDVAAIPRDYGITKGRCRRQVPYSIIEEETARSGSAFGGKAVVKAARVKFGGNSPEDLVRMYAELKTFDRVASKLNVHKDTARRWVREAESTLR